MSKTNDITFVAEQLALCFLSPGIENDREARLMIERIVEFHGLDVKPSDYERVDEIAECYYEKLVNTVPVGELLELFGE